MTKFSELISPTRQIEPMSTEGDCLTLSWHNGPRWRIFPAIT